MSLAAGQAQEAAAAAATAVAAEFVQLSDVGGIGVTLGAQAELDDANDGVLMQQALQEAHKAMDEGNSVEQRNIGTHHTSHVTRLTSHVTRHTSHVTRHTSHVGEVPIGCVVTRHGLVVARGRNATNAR
jgi:hypothetical protein